jgi:hypothetical protein
MLRGPLQQAAHAVHLVGSVHNLAVTNIHMDPQKIQREVFSVGILVAIRVTPNRLEEQHRVFERATSLVERSGRGVYIHIICSASHLPQSYATRSYHRIQQSNLNIPL